eukprot:3658226-Amphidinium_carterae.2
MLRDAYGFIARMSRTNQLSFMCGSVWSPITWQRGDRCKHVCVASATVLVQSSWRLRSRIRGGVSAYHGSLAPEVGQAGFWAVQLQWEG